MGSARFASCGYDAPPMYSTYREQRELYEAAKIIQHAYREYKARINSQRQNEAERNAAVVIQSYYRRYKQFCYFKKLHKAAVLIQKHFRMHRTLNCNEEHHVDEQLSGSCLRLMQANDDPRVSPLTKEHQAALTIQHAYRGHYQRKRQAAARKIQKFMRQSRQKMRKIHESSAGVSTEIGSATQLSNGR
uniref:CG-1 domain-containing protein n=1 Tax=Parascaris univalens TaxID=6257 RepID=A0A915BZP1_PARUN